jgi:hypothetical protein
MSIRPAVEAQNSLKTALRPLAPPARAGVRYRSAHIVPMPSRTPFRADALTGRTADVLAARTVSFRRERTPLSITDVT